MKDELLNKIKLELEEMSIVPEEITEEDAIMEIYKKYQSEIEEIDTHDIYLYSSTYMSLNLTLDMIKEGYPFEIEVRMDDPRATHRYYYNIEGLYAECIKIEDVEEFEKENIVIYSENPLLLERQFIIASIKHGQEEAMKMILKNRTTK